MKFIDAIQTGKKIRSVNWSDNQSINTIIFKENLDKMTLELMKLTGGSISYYDMFGEWEFVESEIGMAKTDSPICKDGAHEKVYSSEALTSFPPQRKWICRRCGAEGTRLVPVSRGTGGTYSNEYDAVKVRFIGRN